jgi:hypothetical protein
MIARSWNSRIANAERPWRAVSSPRSASTCRTSAVDESDSANAVTSAVGHGSPSENAAAECNLHTAGAEDGVTHHPEPGWLQLEPDYEQQQHDAELGEVKDVLDVLEKGESPGPDHHSGGEVPKHCAEFEAPEQGHGNDGGGEKYCDLACECHGLPIGARRGVTMDQMACQGNGKRGQRLIVSPQVPTPTATSAA